MSVRVSGSQKVVRASSGLAPGEHRGAVEPPVEVGVLAGVEATVAVAVLVEGLQEQVALTAAGVVGVVAVAVLRRVDEVAVAHIERHGDARAEVDQVDRVVAQVVVVAAHPAGEVGEVEVVVEGDGERLEGSPAVEAVEALAELRLEGGRSHEARVERSPVGEVLGREGRDVVGEGISGSGRAPRSQRTRGPASRSGASNGRRRMARGRCHETPARDQPRGRAGAPSQSDGDRGSVPARNATPQGEMFMATINAHITGTVWKIEVKVGDTVSAGDVVVILESMKMEMPVEAEEGGTVTAINVSEAQAVNEGDALVTLG
jgi:acetyl-CoA carboxylase biotin carboxyl carrier protein